MPDPSANLSRPASTVDVGAPNAKRPLAGPFRSIWLASRSVAALEPKPRADGLQQGYAPLVMSDCQPDADEVLIFAARGRRLHRRGDSSSTPPKGRKRP